MTTDPWATPPSNWCWTTSWYLGRHHRQWHHCKRPASKPPCSHPLDPCRWSCRHSPDRLGAAHPPPPPPPRHWMCPPPPPHQCKAPPTHPYQCTLLRPPLWHCMDQLTPSLHLRYRLDPPPAPRQRMVLRPPPPHRMDHPTPSLQLPHHLDPPPAPRRWMNRPTAGDRLGVPHRRRPDHLDRMTMWVFVGGCKINENVHFTAQ